MLLLRWVWTETGQEKVAPAVAFYTLRGLMFVLSFVLEDWAIHELVQSPRRRREAMVLVASSYITWTYQTHTFSNAIETLLVAWSLVLIQRIVENKVAYSCGHFNHGGVDSRTAAIVHLFLRSPSFPRRLRALQSHHLPCFRSDTWITASTSLPPQVSPTPRIIDLDNN